MKSVICFVFIVFTSVRAKVAITKDQLPELTSNTIREETKPIIIELPVYNSTDHPTISADKTLINIDDLDTPNIQHRIDEVKPKCTEKDNELDSDGVSCDTEKDNGTALILTEFLENNRSDDARSASRVNPDLFLGFESYSGFLTVNKTYNSNLFFWYFPVQNKSVSESPWIIWLQGGPGASSMTGLFDELGPFTVNSNVELIPNPFSWLKNHSLLFIDNPVGTGYSFTEHPDGFTQDMDTYGSHLHTALTQFLSMFPELRGAPLFVSGESYGGKYVPALAAQIHRRKIENDSDINLKGLIIGNAYVEPAMISQMSRSFYNFGLIDSKQLETIQPLEEAFQQDIAANRSVQAKQRWSNLITVLLLTSSQHHAYNFLRDDLSVGRYLPFLQRSEVKRALHVGDVRFSFVNMTVNTKLSGDFLSTAKPLYEELLEDYKVLTYCGQLDQMLPCAVTSETFRSWRWSSSKDFLDAMRLPYKYKHRNAGYIKSGGGLTEVVVRGAGHMAALDAPGPTQQLVARWTAGETLAETRWIDFKFMQDFVKNNSQIFYM